MNGRSLFTYVNENRSVGALESLESRPELGWNEGRRLQWPRPSVPVGPVTRGSLV